MHRPKRLLLASPSPHFGKWYTIYQRFRRWIDNGVFDRVEKYLQIQTIDREKLTSLSLDSTHIKVHPDDTGGATEEQPQGAVDV